MRRYGIPYRTGCYILLQDCRRPVSFRSRLDAMTYTKALTKKCRAIKTPSCSQKSAPLTSSIVPLASSRSTLPLDCRQIRNRSQPTAGRWGSSRSAACCACSRRAPSTCGLVRGGGSFSLEASGNVRRGLGGAEEGGLADLALDVASLLVLHCCRRCQ